MKHSERFAKNTKARLYGLHLALQVRNTHNSQLMISPLTVKVLAILDAEADDRPILVFQVLLGQLISISGILAELLM